MRRGSVPMRVRRRQSDAKWRASVATCYDTLKHVIPDCEKISKRKISKALILQETEKHINNLENVLKDLLSDKARSRGKVILYQTEQGLVEANFSDIQHDLTLKQQNLYLQNYGQCKRSRIPSDIEASIVNLRSTYCPLTVLPAECLQQTGTDTLTLPSNKRMELADGSKENTFHSELYSSCSLMTSSHHDCTPSCNETHSIPSETPIKRRPKRIQNKSAAVSDFEYYSPGEITPDKNSFNRYLQVTPKSGRNTHKNRTPLSTYTSSDFHLDKNTPMKQPTDGKNLISLSNMPTGFTPVKLPPEFGTPDGKSVVQTGFTPIKLPEDTPESPFTTICLKTFSPESKERLDCEYAWSEQLGLTSLLCDETMDYMELGDDEDLAKRNSRTPQNSMKPNDHRAEKGRKFRSTTSTITNSTTSVCDYLSSAKKSGSKCRRQLEKCFESEKENLPVHTDTLDADTSCLDFDGYFLFYQYVAGDKNPDKLLEEEMTSKVTKLWKEMPEDTRDTFIAMAAMEGSQSSHLSDDLKELDVKPIEKSDVIPMDFKTENDNQKLFYKKQKPKIYLPPVAKTYRFCIPEKKDNISLQEVPMNEIILPCTTEQLLVPEISQTVTVEDCGDYAVVPDMFTHENMQSVRQETPMDHMQVAQNVDVYVDHGDFHMVPDIDPDIYNCDRARADDLGFISLSNENSMSEEFSQPLSPHVTVEDLTEWQGDIIPIM